MFVNFAQDAGWNVFDLCLVVLAVYDQAMFFVWRLGSSLVFGDLWFQV